MAVGLMPRYVSGPGAMGRPLDPSQPVVIGFVPNRVERWLLAFFLYGRIVKHDDRP